MNTPPVKFRLKSFSHAFDGGVALIATQANFRVHLIITLVVVILGLFLSIPRSDWILLTLAIGLVWVAEAFNTSIEFLADELTKETRIGIKKTKDVAAFAVLASTLTAATIGTLVFAPYLSHGR